METALVTGATGMLGRCLVGRLIARGERVLALVRPARSAAADRARADLSARGAELVEGDLTDAVSLASALAGVATVYHAAGRPPTDPDPRLIWRVNADGTDHLVRAACRAGVARFVHVSTVDVYGYDGHNGADEGTPFRPDGPYAASKIAAERTVIDAHEREDLPATILRPCLIHGPGDRHMLPQVGAVLGGGIVPLVGGGRTLMDLVYVGDVVEAVVRAGERSRAVGEAFNVTDGRRRTVRESMATLARVLELSPRFIPLPYAPVYGLATLASGLERRLGLPISNTLRREIVKAMAHDRHFAIAKAQRRLDYAPTVSFEEGLRRALAQRQLQAQAPVGAR